MEKGSFLHKSLALAAAWVLAAASAGPKLHLAIAQANEEALRHLQHHGCGSRSQHTSRRQRHACTATSALATGGTEPGPLLHVPTRIRRHGTQPVEPVQPEVQAESRLWRSAVDQAYLALHPACQQPRSSAGWHGQAHRRRGRVGMRRRGPRAGGPEHARRVEALLQQAGEEAECHVRLQPPRWR